MNQADAGIIDKNVDMQLLTFDGVHTICNRFWILHINEKILGNQKRR